MAHMERLIELIAQNNGMILTSQVDELRIPRQYLSILVEKGQLERMAQGVYLSTTALEDRLFRLQQRCSPGVYSHETALFLHQMTDREPLTSMMTVPAGYNGYHLQGEPIKLFYIRKEVHSIGQTTAMTAFGRTVPCYDIERTICDIIRSRSHMDSAITNIALRQYFNKRGRNLPLLIHYADQLGIRKLLRNYVEVLL